MGLKANLVSYWRLDESSAGSSPVTRVDSFGSNNLTDNNNIASGAAKVGAASASLVAASSQYFSGASIPFRTGGDVNFSIQAWVKLTSKSADQFVVAKWGAAAVRDYALYYDAAADRFKFIVASTGGASSATAIATNFGSPSTGTWYLLHAFHDAAGNTIGISVNAGTANTTAWASTTNTSASTLAVGRNDDGGSNYLDALIDEVAFWLGKTLSATERAQLYNAGNGLSFDAWDLPAQPPPFTSGPPQPGVPWFSLTRAQAFPVRNVPAPPAPQTASGAASPPGFGFGGPAIPGSPWFARALVLSRAVGSNPPPAPPPETPTGVGRGRTRPFLPNVPARMKAADDRPFWERAKDSGDASDEYHRRAARFTEGAHYIFNALISQGVLVQTSPSSWALRSGGFVQDRAPTVTDDRSIGATPGCHWVDQTAEHAYVCISNDVGAAVWKLTT